MGESMVADIPSLVGVLKLDTVDQFTQSVQKGKGSMPGFELSFDKHDTRRVLRTMIRRLEGTTEPSEGSPDTPDNSDPAKPTDSDSKSEN